MTRYFEIAVLAPSLQAVFDYHVADSCPLTIEPGHLVVVPFGSQRVQGIVLRPIKNPSVPETKPIEEVLDPEPVLTPGQMRLGEWMSEYYRTPLETCLAAMLPPGLARHAEGRWELIDGGYEPQSVISRRLIELFKERGALRTGQIRHAFGRVMWEREAERLVRTGVLSRRSILPPPSVRPKHVRRARLALSDGNLRSAIAYLRSPTMAARSKPASERRARILESLGAENAPMETEWVYAASGANLSDLKWLAEEGWVDLIYEEKIRDPLAEKSFDQARIPSPTMDQTQASSAIRQAMDAASSKPFLLFGVTGSGKTEVYMRAVEETIARGKQAIILVPEIGLTPQTVRRFGERFPGRIGLIHSMLSPGERYDTWRRARAGLIDVVLGPRSALFSPLPRIGLIVLDEEHDDSYKSSSAPCFHARETAVEYARQVGAILVLGSASPSLTSYHAAQTGRMSLLKMSDRVDVQNGSRAELPPVEIVDMRQELRVGNRSIFSRELASALEGCWKQGEQAILFLNRRGTASAIVCRDCGKSVECPRCAIPLTLHEKKLLCHRCGYARNIPLTCPNCASATIRPLGVGTKQVEETVQKQFPGIRTLRWDRDAVDDAGAHDILIEHFAAHRADVLIGTQMVAKGLDLPHVTLVGMVLADVGLLLPDYRSSERVFQVLMQVAGRAGRGEAKGRAILQTYTPEHYALGFAARHDYAGFAEEELKRRAQLSYPPYSKLVRLVFSHHDPEKTRAESEAMAEAWRRKLPLDLAVIGPVPCFFEKWNGLYRWQIILRGESPSSLVEKKLPPGWQADVDPISLL